MRDFLEFEKPLKEIEERLEKLKKSGSERKAVPRLIRMLQTRLAKTEQEIFGNLTPWQQTQIARHPQRPSILHYTNRLCEDFLELHGDRTFGDDKAIVGGFATFRGRSICVIGHAKGQSFKERVKRNFGMPNPEGYRKALRLMQLAEKFKRPVVTFIDTPGAYPGIGAEERGQARAIANCSPRPRKIQTPGRHVYRYAGSLSRHRSRGTGPGQGHCQKPVRDVPAQSSDRRHHCGRRGKRRGVGFGGRRPDRDAGTLDLLGHFPGRVRGDPLGRCNQDASRSRGLENDRRGRNCLK